MNNNQNNSSLFPFEAFNKTLKPNQYYGLPDSSNCSMQGCVPNTVNQNLYPIPSLQEIADFHNQTISDQTPGGQVPTNSPTATSNLNNPQSQGDNVNQPIPSTPTTTLDYGATIENNLQREMEQNITDIANPYPVTPESLQYLNGFIRTQIGRRVSIDFLVGSNTIVTKSGFLLGVAANYILINELDTNDITTCDFYNIKFIRFYF